MFNLLFVATAYAQAAGEVAPKTPSLIEMLILPAGFLLIMYFFMIRPQQKKSKEHATMLGGLKAGDEVVTTGGIIGRVKSVAEGFVSVEISGNVAVKVLKSHVAGLTKTEASKTPEKNA